MSVEVMICAFGLGFALGVGCTWRYWKQQYRAKMPCFTLLCLRDVENQISKIKTTLN